jgi:hypothetical protein
MSVIALAAVATACSEHNVRGTALEVRRRPGTLTIDSTVSGTGPITAAGLRFTARNSGLESRWPPVIVRVTVMAHNTTDHRVRVNMLGTNCTVRLRIYPARRGAEHGAAPTDRAPVFNSASSNFSCYVPLLHLNLAPGDSTSFQSAGGGPGVTLPPGRYDLVGVITIVPGEDTLRRHGAMVIEVPAGTIRVAQPYE